MISQKSNNDHDLAYFLAIPEYATILNSLEYTIQPTRSRSVKSSGEDELFAVTLNTPLTIPYCLTVSRCQNQSDPDKPISEVRTFLRLESGLNGYPDICHGGIVATIFDEIMGVAAYIHHQQIKAVQKRKGTYVRGSRAPSMTVELVTQYIRPVVIPASVSVIVWPPKFDGRKTWIEADLQNEKGEVLSKGKGLFVQLKRANI